MEILGKSFDLITAKGVFSANSIDKGTAVLLNYLESERGLAKIKDLASKNSNKTLNIFDIGTGWGIISVFAGLLFKSKLPDINADISGIDVNLHAVEVTNLNAKALNLPNVKAYSPKKLPDDIMFDLILSNPPIRIGKSATLALLNTYLKRLSDNGIALLVIQKNLGSDSIATALNSADFTCEKVASAKGFRILQISRK